MTDKQERALALEPDGPMLLAGLAELGQRHRPRLLAKLRAQGLGHLTAGLIDRADPELLAAQGYDELWKLAHELPLHRARNILLELSKRGFAGGDEFTRAAALAAITAGSPRPVARHPSARCLAGRARVSTWAGAS